jgi:Fe-S oxidoreductase
VTTTYDPKDPAYWDDGDLREELNRVLDLCHGCRLCFKFCTAFPTLFEMIDRHDDQDAARLTGAEQEQVVHECFNCKLCYVNCPYVPGQHEWALDFPRLMLRSEAVFHETGKLHLDNRVQGKLADEVLGRTDLLGKLGTRTAPLLNRATATPGSLARRVMEKTTGIAAQRVLAPFAKVRFSTWFRRRATLRFAQKQGSVALFPTCMVEYQHPAIGKDLVKVYERNGIECSLPEGQVCCGAPWLHAGDVPSFRKQAEKNVAVLASAVRAGRDVVVPQPTCAYVLKKDYPDYVGGPDAELVASHTYDAAEYLVKVHKADDSSLDLGFGGQVPEKVTYHAPCHLRAQNIGLKSRDLMKLTGAKVTVVAECSGIDGSWGLKAENYDRAKGVARKMRVAMEKSGGDVIAGDCSLANGAITEETGKVPLHPLQVMARAYGIEEEPDT